MKEIHGHAKKKAPRSKTYTTWNNMVSRCTKPYHDKFYMYGARGITVCNEWLDFSNFLRDMGERPEGKTLDRVDNTKGYSKENCRWADRETQQRNMRRNNNVTLCGKTQCLEAWARELGVYPTTIKHRIKAGWSEEKILNTPSLKTKSVNPYSRLKILSSPSLPGNTT